MQLNFKLKELTTDLLDLSKIEAGQLVLDKKRSNLHTVVQNVLTNFQYLLKERKIELINKEDLELTTFSFDPLRISQVLNNLLSNAIKFSNPNGKITIATGIYEKDPNFVMISISDTGIGISEEDIPKLFKRFQQVGSSEKKIAGTGLGLALCKEIVELHQGKIWVESTKGQGSTFLFLLPMQSKG